MPDERVKRRQRYAKNKAMNHYRRFNYSIYQTAGLASDFIAGRTADRCPCVVMAILNEVTEQNKKALKSLTIPHVIEGQFYVLYDDGDFEIKPLD